MRGLLLVQAMPRPLDCKTISMQDFLTRYQFPIPNPTQSKAERVRSLIAADQRTKLEQYRESTNELGLDNQFRPGKGAFA